MNVSTRLNTLIILFVSQFISCNTFIDPYDENAKVYIEDGHITFESAHNKDINFKSNFGQIKLNGVQIQDLLKLVNNYKSDRQLSTFNKQQPQLTKLTQTINELKDKIKNYEKLENDVKDLKESMRQILNDNRIKPENVFKSVSGYRKIKKMVDKFKELMDVNECESNPCRNEATNCIDLFGDYMCQCSDGWVGKNCDQDVDECKLYAGTTLGCQNNAQCINTPGSYHCICKNGYQGTQCTSSPNSNHPCDLGNRELCGHGQCVSSNNNSTSGLLYSCICEPGWRKESTSPACTEDIDECDLHREWAQRILSEKQADLTNLPKQICSIKPLVECFNTLGSFRCGPCPKGYVGSGQFCYDENECEINNGGCSTSPFVQCINTEGSKVCGPCPEHFVGDGVNCEIDSKLFDFETPFVYNSDVHTTDKACPTNPCMNDANCYLRNVTRPHNTSSMTKDDFYCLCELGFTGKYCETIINYCVSEIGPNKTLDVNGPCKNDGKCNNLIGGFLCACEIGWQGDTCETPKDSCGGDFYETNGTIRFTTAEYMALPNRNPFNCEWKIDAAIGKVIQINIVYLNLELTPSCMDQYLKISDGIPGLTENRQLVKLCGNLDDLPKNSTNITSAHNYITVNYMDHNIVEQNSDNSSFGFELEYRSVDPKCGGLIVDVNHGSINSPGFPKGYPLLSDCIWILKTKLNKRIQLYFAELSIEGPGNCLNDFVEIFDGETDQDPLLGKFCNTTIGPPLISSGPFVRIHLMTDAFNSDKGFHLTYNAISSIQNCGGLYTNDKDVISSPSFPIKYQNNLECVYQIRLKDANERIKLTIDYLDLEEHSNCKFDYLEFYDGPDEFSKKIDRHCLPKSINSTLLSSGNVMFIKFRTDKSFRGNGFILSYSKLCGYTYTEKSSVIKSNGYPKLQSGDILCFYEIMVTANSVIKLEFQDLDIEHSPNCTTDSLSIYETLQVEKKKFCGNSVPDIYISNFNNLVLVFRIKHAFRYRGFKLNYSSIEVGCGGVLSDDLGFFSSPLSDNSQTYKANANCNWIIRAPSNQVIKLSFNTFSIEKHSNCKFDYVRVLDSQFNQIGKWCGNQPPPQIQSMDSELVVQFASDKTNQLEGFSASYVFANSNLTCGSHLAHESGFITSPGYMKRYPPNLNCVWHIVASVNRQIRLNFTFLDIESNDCAYDKIEIHNGPETSSPLLATVCGQIIPPLITSHSNELTIVFITDSSKETKGFRLTYDTALRGCGGLVSSPTGSIASPNYPRNYGHNAECDYSIYVAKGSVISLNFAEIDIERQDECIFDYVELYDGNDEFSPKIGRYCNLNNSPGVIKSSTNAVFVRFRSDASDGKKGFLLNYVTNCTNRLSGYRGVIESLNFPNPYFSVFNCRYEISVPRGNKINLVFTSLVLEDNNEDCSEVSLTIEEQQANGNVEKNSTRRLCDSKQIDEQMLNFNTTSNTVVITFRRNKLTNDAPKSLIRVEWYLVGCGGEFLYKSTGVIQTPNYPKQHFYELDCVWHIYTNPSNRIVLMILDFDISTGGKCFYGFVQVLGGPTLDSPEIGKICEKPSDTVVLTSSGSSMTVILKNQLGISGRGFNAKFLIDRNRNCGGTYTTNEATITSPNYPALYDATDECFYRIESTELKQIQITIVDLLLPSLKNCTGGELTIYDGGTIKSKVLRKECGDKLSDDPRQNSIISTSNKVLIRFKANGHAVNKGFKLTYKMICGGMVVLRKDKSYTLSSPNYPLFSQVNRQCKWYFTCDYDQKMAITITHLEPSNSYFQTPNFLQFRSGLSDDAPVINTFYKSIPSTFSTPGNGLTISSQRIVFRLMINTMTTSCGGQIKVTNEGEFSSPNFGVGNYPLKASCDFTLSSGFSNRIKLEFLDFKLQQSDYCNLDYVEIRENNRHGLLIGRFCGHELPAIDSNFLHALPQSTSNQTNASLAYEMGFNKLWVRFKSEDSGTDAGFRIKYALVKDIFLTQESGQISSSQYPDASITEEEMQWHLSTADATVISLTVKKIQLTMLRDSLCLSEIRIYDGFDVEATLLKRICGLEPPEQPIVSSGNQMTIVYSSHGMSMFLLEYKAVNQLAYESNRTQQIATMNTNCSEQYLLSADNSTIITSPGYPTSYGINLLCTYEIHAPTGQKIRIFIDDLDVEGVNCYYDKLTIYDRTLDNDMYLNETLCGRKKNISLITHSNFAKIEFITDSIGTGTGFKLALSTQCGGYLTGKQRGVLSFNAGRMNDYKCTWVISVRPKRKMKLRFTSLVFGYQADKDCTENFVLIRDGPSSSSPILGKYCNRTLENLEINETSSNQVYVTFFALRGLYQAFKLHYEEIRVGCTQKYRLESKEDSIIIETPNYPNPPQGIIECDWSFSAPPATSIRIDFKSLNPSLPCNLSQQAVSIYNGGSPYSSLITRDCPRYLSSISTTENMMHVNYITTDAENLHAAFQAQVQVSICGGTHIIRQRVLLKSKNWPSKYPNNLDCKYYFQAISNTFNLEFKITKLDLANNSDSSDQSIANNSTDCSMAGDFLEIRDTDVDGPVLGRFCGSHPKKVQIVNSYSDRAFIQFKTDSERTGSGFLVEIRMIIHKCGETISDATVGVIKSPNYESGVNSDLMKSLHRNCRWLLTAKPTNRIELTFKKINLKSDPTNRQACIDTLIFYSKPVRLLSKKVKELNVGTYCNFRVGQTITSLHSSMVIDFTTFGLSENEGFVIEYDATKEALCGGELTSEKGTIEMPNDYSRNQTYNFGDVISCLWYIKADQVTGLAKMSNYTITLNIEKLEFPDPPDAGALNWFKSLRKDDNLGRSLNKFINKGVNRRTCGNSSVLIGAGTRAIHQYSSYRFELCSNLTGLNLFYSYAQSSIFLPMIYGQMIIGNEPKLMRINYKINRCGQTYYSLGTFSSPNYGVSNYENNLVCVYTINVFSVGKLQLEFDDFDLEEDATCSKDYVEILNGFIIDDSPSLGRFCGKNKPKPVISSGSSLSIIFRTNSANTAKGFQMAIKKYETNLTCGDDINILNYPQRFVYSPFYPNQYKNNMQCLWTIQVNPEYHMKIEFTSRFDIENSTDCKNDYLLITEKTSENSWKFLNKLCGIKLAEPIITKSNAVRVMFRTNENVTGDGFQFHVTRQCGRMFDGDSPTEGYILSPGYDNSISDSNLRCTYTFNRTKNDFIVLKLEDFDLSDCPNDYVMILRDRNVDESATTTNETLLDAGYQVHSHINSMYGNFKKIGPFCGEVKPPNLITSNEFLKVLFVTDAYESPRGFKFSYKIIECGKKFENMDNGVILSPNVEQSEENSYIHNADCYWNVKVEENYSIVVRFEYLSIEACGKLCHCDYVEINEVTNFTRPLAKLCGYDQLPIIKSNSNQISIHFHSDYTGSSSGFKLIWSKTIGEKLGCGKSIFANQNGYIESPDVDKDGKYEKNLDCVWTISVPENQVIKLNFEKFDLEEIDKATNECKDFIQVNDGSSSTEPLIDIFCGKRKLDQLVSSSNRMFIYFKSDDLNESTGFKIKYEIVSSTCGEQIRLQNEGDFINNANSTFIYSPNYPEPYPKSIRCAWTFSVPFYNRLELNISEFNLNCSNNDYLQFSFDRKHENLIKICTQSEYLTNRRFMAMNGLWMVFNSGQGSYESNLLLANTLDRSSTDQKFRFKIGYKILSCNQSYTAENGFIVSSRFPAMWSVSYNEICKFTIETDVTRTISVYFTEFAVGKLNSTSCNENRMEVRNGKLANSRKLAVLCGFTLPNPIFSSGNVLSFYVRAIDTYNKYYMYYTTSDQGIGCGGNLTSFNGTFTSPLYPNTYNEIKECIWKLHSLGRHKLTVRFDVFEFNTTQTCDSNYLEIYDGETMSKQTYVRKLCAQDRPSDYASKTNFMVFKLVVGDTSGVKFKISYNINLMKGINNQIFADTNSDHYLSNDAFSLIRN